MIPSERRVARTFVRICGTLAMLNLLAVAGLAADPKTAASGTNDWPQFLGPQRNGISRETGLMKAWPKDGPKEVWRAPAGVGMSGLAISGGKLVTMFQQAGKQKVICLDAATGKPQWQKDAGPEYKNQQGDGPRATPAIVEGSVYAYTGDGTLMALDLKDGAIRWQHNVPAEFKAEPAEYGMASSPLVAGELVIVTAGAPGAAVAAYDRTSGKLAWKYGSDTAGYSSPTLLTLAGMPQVVTFTGKAAVGLSPKDGAQLWRFPWETDFDCNIATPLAVGDDQLFISSGENHGSALLSLAKSGDVCKVSTVWTGFGPESTLRNEWQTSILLDGHLYGLDNVGSAGPVTHLTCVEVASGKRVWQQLRFGKSNLISADGKLFLSTMKGELVVVRAIPERFDELGRGPVLGATRQAPALANGRLYLRDNKEIVCLDARE